MNEASLLRAALALGITLSLSGCGRGFGPLPDSPRVSQCEPGQPGGRLVLAVQGTPTTFNPLLADGASDAVTRMLFAGLADIDLVTMEAIPALAESWTVAADQKTWTFKLRKGVRWSDGKPLTARDVEFTWNNVIFGTDHPALQSFQSPEKRFTVTRINDQELTVVTPEVFPQFVHYFGNVPILPRHVFSSHTGNQLTNAYTFYTRPDRVVGSGPFRVKDYRRNQYVLLEYNREYWTVDRNRQRLPYLDEVLITNVPPGAAAPLFLQDQTDVCEVIRPEEWPFFVQANPKRLCSLVEIGPGAEREFLWFNQNTNRHANGQPLVHQARLRWFRDKRFRQAVSSAINRDQIALDIYGGRAKPIHGFLSSENEQWFNPNTAAYDYNLDRARALLADMGLRDSDGDGILEDADGNRVEFTFFTNAENPLRGRAAMLIQDQLLVVGIKANLQPAPFRSLVEKINYTFDYECALMGLGGGSLDPSSQINVLKSGEPLHQWFPLQPAPSTEWEARIDTLMDLQMSTLGFQERKRAFDEVQAIWAEELPMISTVIPHAATAFRADLSNVRPVATTPYRSTWNIEELFFRNR